MKIHDMYFAFAGLPGDANPLLDGVPEPFANVTLRAVPLLVLVDVNFLGILDGVPSSAS